jgi:hypothetical protein
MKNILIKTKSSSTQYKIRFTVSTRFIMIQMIQQHFYIVKIMVLLALHRDIFSVCAQNAMPAPIVVPSPVSVQFPSSEIEVMNFVAPPASAPVQGSDVNMVAPSVAAPSANFQTSKYVGSSQLRGGYGGMGSGSARAGSNDDVHDADSADNNDDVNDADSVNSADNNDDVNDADSVDSADSADNNDDVNDADSADNNDDVNDVDSADGATTQKSSLSMQSMTSAGTTVPRHHVVSQHLPLSLP